MAAFLKMSIKGQKLETAPIDFACGKMNASNLKKFPSVLSISVFQKVLKCSKSSI